MNNIFITGASKGIGKETAIYLSGQGHRIFAGCRSKFDYELLEKTGNGNIIPVQIDVTNKIQIEAGFKKIKKYVGERGLQGLVNNAGMAVPGPYEFLPIDVLREQMEINFIGQVAVTQQALPLIRQGKGRIVNISSISGMFAYPFVGAYASSKFALEAFTDSLRRELLLAGIHVASVQPGNVDTPIWSTSIQKAEKMIENFPPEVKEYYPKYSSNMLGNRGEENRKGMPPQLVVNAISHALFSKRPRIRYPIGRTANLIKLVKKFVPEKVIDLIVKRALTNK